MGIVFCDNKKTFSLHTENTTYQMQVDRYGFLLHLYYGRKAEGCMDYLLTYADRGFSGNPHDAGKDRTYSLDSLPLEYSCRGCGDYRSPAFLVKNGDGSYGCDLRYQGHQIIEGKYSLDGLPAVYAGESEAQTLEITLADEAAKLRVVLLYGVLPHKDIITRSVRVYNDGAAKIYLEKIHSASVDFLHGDYDFIRFYGRHAMERNYQRMPVAHGTQSIESRRGASSHQYHPTIILADQDATERWGSCYGMTFVYSGGFKCEVEQDQYNQVRMTMGLPDEMFSYPLMPGEMFTAPEVILTYSSQGLNKLSQNFHRCIRRHVCRGTYRDQVRPVLLNSWEACYFDFSGESVFELAKQAADLNMEMLVMDDGWFGHRESDNSSLGDWYVNEEKLGGTLGELIERINGLGIKFGIWVEPEMVSEDSDLYRSHPDWALAVPGRKPVRSREQLVLDFSKKEVVDYIYEQICGILDQGNIEYLKWDMNRSLEDIYSTAAEDQGRVLHDYVLGLYDFMERLVLRYPNLLIEGCSGGGGRYDAGMLYYTPQIWCSDNTDAVDRVRIQYGTSFVFPAQTMGAHVSAVPNHQTGRITSMETRGIVALGGAFGYELNPRTLSEDEKKIIREQVAAYHQYAPLMQNGLYYRLSNPFSQEVGAWSFVSEDQKEVLCQAVRLEVHGNMTNSYVRLDGLRPDAVYREKESGSCYSGAALMEVGFPLPLEVGDYQAYQYYFSIL